MYARGTASAAEQSTEAQHSMSATLAHQQPPHVTSQFADCANNLVTISSAIDRDSQQHGPDQVTHCEHIDVQRHGGATLTPQPTCKNDPVDRSIDRPTDTQEPGRHDHINHTAPPRIGGADQSPHPNHAGLLLPRAPPQPPPHTITPQQSHPNAAPHHHPNHSITPPEVDCLTQPYLHPYASPHPTHITQHPTLNPHFRSIDRSTDRAAPIQATTHLHTADCTDTSTANKGAPQPLPHSADIIHPDHNDLHSTEGPPDRPIDRPITITGPVRATTHLPIADPAIGVASQRTRPAESFNHTTHNHIGDPAARSIDRSPIASEPSRTSPHDHTALERATHLPRHRLTSAHPSSGTHQHADNSPPRSIDRPADAIAPDLATNHSPTTNYNNTHLNDEHAPQPPPLPHTDVRPSLIAQQPMGISPDRSIDQSTASTETDRATNHYYIASPSMGVACQPPQHTRTTPSVPNPPSHLPPTNDYSKVFGPY